MFVKLARSSAVPVGVITVTLVIGEAFLCRDAASGRCCHRGDMTCW